MKEEKFDDTKASSNNFEQELDSSKQVFLSVVSHQFRTPLNHIMGFSQIIMDEVGHPDSHVFASHIYASGERLLNMIEDIIYLSNLEKGDVKINAEYISIGDIERDIRKTVKNYFLAEDKSEVIDILWNVEEEISNTKVLIDRFKTNLIICQIIDNAIRFTKQGTIELSLSMSNDSELNICISDTGVGMSPEKLTSIYDAFSVEMEGYIFSSCGLGIGLTICKMLIQKMKGKIEIESELNKGTKVFIILPVSSNK
jgi:signal transduction histidine kinase